MLYCCCSGVICVLYGGVAEWQCDGVAVWRCGGVACCGLVQKTKKVTPSNK